MFLPNVDLSATYTMSLSEGKVVLAGTTGTGDSAVITQRSYDKVMLLAGLASQSAQIAESIATQQGCATRLTALIAEVNAL